ncbi:MAG: Phosphoglycolate phosphatase [Phycisphaerae bacterium]|nr:Phosphoglycolate phosphatase [Phycisphaerae bacterium]
MRVKPRAILFDLGETLLFFGGVDRLGAFKRGARAGHAYLTAQGFRLGKRESFVRRLVARGRKALLINRISRREVNIADLFGLVTGHLQRRMPPAVWREFVMRMYDPLANVGRADPQAKAVLGAIRDAGIRMALISNTFVPDFAIDAHLARVGLIDWFPERFYSASEGVKKPSLTLFRRALAAINVSADETWHVGDDLLADVLGARRAGITTVLRLRPGRRVRWWWPIRPDLVIHELTDLLRMLQR